jgi:TRAP transporter TAXI family solute receptor
VPGLARDADDRRTHRWVLLAAAAGLVALVALLARLFAVLVDPAPPRSVTMSTGPGDGAYHAFALRYRAHLARYGVELVLKQSDGSLQNLERLKAGRDGVEIALVQGGVADAADTPGVMTLGSVFYEPVWLFWRGEDPPASVAQLRGKRIAIDQEGSGTRALALRLLRANGLDQTTAQLDAAGGLEAAEKLEQGRLDAAIFVSAPEAAAIRRLMRAQGVRLAGTERAQAYTRRFPFLQEVVLPAGTMDLARDVPSEDQRLIAVTASLLASERLHPVIVDLLLEAARAVHGGGTLLNGPGQFPALRDPDFPVSADARRIYDGEYSFLRRYLPFWVAVWVQRLAFFAIPLLALGIPLLRLLPKAYDWGERRRINRWYGELKFLELAVRQARGDPAAHRERLQAIEERVGALRLPVAYSAEYYTLLSHIELVSRLLDARLRSEGAVPAKAGTPFRR